MAVKPRTELRRIHKNATQFAVYGRHLRSMQAASSLALVCLLLSLVQPVNLRNKAKKPLTDDASV